MKIYEVWAVENDPDTSRGGRPAQGKWTWWRTGPHPMGRWQAMDWQEPNFGVSYAANRQEFPIMQDNAIGDGSSFGGATCHACDYRNEGYPDPNHYTACDGVCRWERCEIHGEVGRLRALSELKSAYDFALRAGLTKKDIIAHIKSL